MFDTDYDLPFDQHGNYFYKHEILLKLSNKLIVNNNDKIINIFKF